MQIYNLFTALIVTSLPQKPLFIWKLTGILFLIGKKYTNLQQCIRFTITVSQNIYLKLFQIQEVMILHIELEIDCQSAEYKDVSFFSLPLLQLIMHTAVTENI